MTKPIRILLQTTIAFTDDDWHIGRFSLLRQFLASQVAQDGSPLFAVTARDRAARDGDDPVLSTLDRSDYDELWLFAVDTGDGLTGADCGGISRFRQRGGGLMVTRDHMDLGSSVCTLGGVGAAHYFHSKQPDPDPARRHIDDTQTKEILWPNYHSGANGDYQEIEAVGSAHPVLAGPVLYLPSHPHEGAVGAPADDPTARVIATGRSTITGNTFNIAVAFEPSAAGGPAIAESTFHHFVDYNWDIAAGAPSFVSEPPGKTLAGFPAARRSTERYIRNLALWLAGKMP
ncbi:MAG TPA: hypothetical protein VGN07_10355 [Steroidobacteraceae bacterium]